MKPNHQVRPERSERVSRPLALGALGLVVVILAAFWWLNRRGAPGIETTVEGLVATIRGWGRWGVLGSIGLMILHSFVPFPAEILAIANGLVYGPIQGAAVTWSGAMLGASAAYAVGRRFGESFVSRLLTPLQSRMLADWAEDQGAGALLIGRLLPVVAFNLVNYAAALTGIRWWTFLWTTAVGILPMTVLTAVLGDHMLTVSPWVWIAALAFSGAAYLAVRVIRRHANKKTS